MRWISYTLIAGGIATIAAGLYVFTTDGNDDRRVIASSQPAVLAKANVLVPPPASVLEPALPVPVVANGDEVVVAEEPAPVESPVAEEQAPAEPPPAPPVAPTTAPRQAAPAPTQPPRPPATATPVPPPPPPPPPPAAPVAPAVSLAGLESAMFAAHNQERANNGLGAFVLDGTLTQVARQRAQDMASKNYFSHTSPTGQTAFTLLNGAGYAYALAGENLARNNYPDAQSVSVAMSAFMSSQSHRVNVLEGKFSRIGIGMAVGADGMKYYAVVFAQPR